MSSFLERQFYRSTLYIYIYIYKYECTYFCTATYSDFLLQSFNAAEFDYK